VPFYASDVDPILMEYADIIDDWAYNTMPFDKDFLITMTRPPVRYAAIAYNMQGYSPSQLFTGTLFYDDFNKTTSLAKFEQLYTARGS
jgi:hypothetical protein